MIRRIIETTDGKYIGYRFDDTQKPLFVDIEFVPDKVQHIGSGLVRYSNANYVVLTREVSNG